MNVTMTMRVETDAPVEDGWIEWSTTQEAGHGVVSFSVMDGALNPLAVTMDTKNARLFAAQLLAACHAAHVGRCEWCGDHATEDAGIVVASLQGALHAGCETSLQEGALATVLKNETRRNG